jgi:PAS domain S-box-containing protein
MVFGIAVWTLAVYAFGGTLPFDSWLMDRRAAAGLTRRLNRMSPVSTICFTFFSASLLLETSPRLRGSVLVQMLSIGGLLFALVSLIGYVYSIAALVSPSVYKPIAPQSAVAFVLCSVCLLLSSPDRGVMRIALSGELGGILARRLLAFVFLLPLVLGGIASAGLRLGFLTAPTSIFFLTATTDLSLAGLLFFNAFTINRSEQRRRTAQSSLTESERAYRTLFESAADPIFIVDAELLVREANAAAASCLGRPVAELNGHPVTELTSLCAPEMTRELRATFSTGHAAFESCGSRPDGSAVPLEINARLVEFRGMPVVLMIARDLSERRRAEKTLAEKEGLLQQAQKMEAIGRLAGGVAHDFNNLLTVIMGYSELLLGKLPPEHEARADAFQIKVCAARAASLTRQLLSFSRRQPSSPRCIELNGVVEEMTPLLRRLIGEQVRLDVRLLSGNSRIRIDPNQLEQIVINLAVNARDAMPEGGTITIQSLDRTIDGAPLPYTPAPADGAYVELIVQDTGSGIPSEIEPHIFEPFFTTKPEEQGTGLGLSTVYGIVTQNEGAIGVQTSPLTGTSMRVLFPLMPADDGDVPQPHAVQLPLVTRSGTILLIEDEAAVRDYLAAGLRRVGYSVLEADRGESALSIVRTYGGGIDAVISDVVMPGISGKSLAEQLIRLLPDAQILFMSGYDEGGTGEINSLCGRFDLITKPFTASDLVEKLGERRSLAEIRGG